MQIQFALEQFRSRPYFQSFLAFSPQLIKLRRVQKLHGPILTFFDLPLPNHNMIRKDTILKKTRLKKSMTASLKALSRLYQGFITALSRLLQGFIKTLSRLYQVFIKSLLGLYQGLYQGFYSSILILAFNFHVFFLFSDIPFLIITAFSFYCF